MSVSPEAGTPTPPKPPRVRLVQGQEVSLGCGTLIIIALIVLFCGGFGTREVQNELSQLRASVNELKHQVEEQTKEIRALQARIEKIQRAGVAEPKEK